jgi:hypothetical protein
MAPPLALSPSVGRVPDQGHGVVEGYGDAIAKSRSAGRPISFRVDVDPDGESILNPVE